MKTHTLALLAALLLAPAAALAQPYEDAAEPTPEDLESARVDLEAGDAYFAAGHYQEAIEAYERGYAKSRKAGFLYNIAQAHRLAGECAAAVERYQAYLAADPDTVRRAQIEQHMSSLASCAEEERAAADPQEPTAAEPAATPQPAAPETSTIVPAPRPDAHQDEAQGASGRWIGAGMATAGVALLGTSGYFAYRGQSAESDLRDRLAPCTPEDPCSPEVYDDALASRGERANTIAWITGISGGLVLAGGITLYLLGDDDDRAASLALSPTAGGAAVVYGGSF